MDYKVRFYDDHGVRVVPVTGEFDLANADVLEAMIEAALMGEKPVVVDLSPTSYIDSTILGLLARYKKRAGSRLRIVVPPEGNIRKVFGITGLRRALAVKDSIEDARIDDVQSS